MFSSKKSAKFERSFRIFYQRGKWVAWEFKRGTYRENWGIFYLFFIKKKLRKLRKNNKKLRFSVQVFRNRYHLRLDSRVSEDLWHFLRWWKSERSIIFIPKNGQIRIFFIKIHSILKFLGEFWKFSRSSTFNYQGIKFLFRLEIWIRDRWRLVFWRGKIEGFWQIFFLKFFTFYQK